jgi:hypothetical protein
VIATLHGGVLRAWAGDEIRARLGTLGCECSTRTPEALATPAATRMVRLRRLIHDAGITGG